MTALLGSVLSRSSPRTLKQLHHPPTLPARANPTSSDAKILGPLSKRREVNLRRKFFERETARVRPPLEVSRVHITELRTPLNDPAKTHENAGKEKPPTPPLVGFQGTSVLRDLELVASPNLNSLKSTVEPTLPDPARHMTAVNRFIRRQHRKILTEIPILTDSKPPNCPTGRYQVSPSPLACSDVLTSAVPMADEADLAWLRLPPPSQTKGGPGPKAKVKSMVGTKSKLDSNRNPKVDGNSSTRLLQVEDNGTSEKL